MITFYLLPSKDCAQYFTGYLRGSLISIQKERIETSPPLMSSGKGKRGGWKNYSNFTTNCQPT